VGLDGVLIGLRTRELLEELLEARCRLSPVFMMIEDLHWIDTASGAEQSETSVVAAYRYTELTPALPCARYQACA